MDLGIRDRVALVLGASGGLGGAVAKELAAEGARVVVAGRRRDALEALVASLNREGTTALPLIWDLSDLTQIDHQVSAIEERFGPVDILFNNTGGPPPTPVAGQDPATWIEQFRTMVISIISLTDRVLPAMRDRKWGRVITSASSGVVTPIPNLGLSNALRLSLVGWSKTLAREVAQDNITVNIILPGRIATRRTRLLDEARGQRESRLVEDVETESAESIPIGRYGEPREYALVVAFLASSASSYVTGSVIRVDGGLIGSL